MTVQIVRFTTIETHVHPVTVLGSTGLFVSHDGSAQS